MASRAGSGGEEGRHASPPGADRRSERIVADRDVRVSAARSDVGVRAARDRFGGIDIPATLVGMLAALALLVLLAGLIGAALGTIGYQKGLDNVADDLSLAGLAGGVIAIFIAFIVGGWTAARVARYNGVTNGVLTAVWALVLAAIVSALAVLFGDEYDVLRRVDLPQWFSTDALTASAIASGIVSVAAMLLGGALGGWWGERYHRRADATIAATRPGGIIDDPTRR